MPTSTLELLVLPPVGWAVALVWGAIWGSFFGLVIHRIGRAALDEEEAWEAPAAAAKDGPAPRWIDEEREHLRWIRRALGSLVGPRSACPRCGAPVAGYDNIPILSFFLLGGRCRACRAPIPWMYPAVEGASVCLAAAVYWRFVVWEPAAASVALQAARFFVYFAFAGVLLVLALIDLRTQLLPDALTYVAIPLFFLLGRLLPDVSLASAAIGLAVGYLGIEALDLLWRLLLRRDALGGGDAKLLALVGGFLGWRALPWALVGGAFLGALVHVPLLLAHWWRERRSATRPTLTGLVRTPVPFGPFLAAGALASLFLERPVHAWLVARLSGE